MRITTSRLFLFSSSREHRDPHVLTPAVPTRRSSDRGGIDRQRPGETHPLAHAAGKLVRIAVLEPGELDLGNVPPRGLLPLLARDAAQLEPECAVAEDGRPGDRKSAV